MISVVFHFCLPVCSMSLSCDSVLCLFVLLFSLCDVANEILARAAPNGFSGCSIPAIQS